MEGEHKMATYARAKSIKDTWITSKSVTSNFGAAPILEIWTRWNDETNKKDMARIIIQFALSSLSSSIVNKGSIPDPRSDTTVSAFVCMTNTKHGDTQATNFTLDVFPLTAAWTEGSGLDNDTYTNTGYANAISATNSNSWGYNNGGSGAQNYLGAASRVYDSNSASMYMENGQEDLKVDVTDYFKAYLNYSTGISIADGGSADFGFLVRMSDVQEAADGPECVSAGIAASLSATSFYSKKFYSRETNTRKRPYLQLQWPGEIKDNRNNIKFSKTGFLYYYSIVDGELTDLNGLGPFPGHVNLSGNGIDIITDSAAGGALTAARHSKGIYKLDIGGATNGAAAQNSYPGPLTGINIGSSGVTAFNDSWTVTTAGEYRTDTFDFSCILPTSGHSSFSTSNYQVSFPNLRNRYDQNSFQRLRVFVNNKPTHWTAVTGTSTAMNTSVINNATVEIRELVTNDIEVPAVGLSYDQNGNFFDLDTSMLYNGLFYKLVLKLNVRGEELIYDKPDDWNFQIGTVHDTYQGY